MLINIKGREFYVGHENFSDFFLIPTTKKHRGGVKESVLSVMDSKFVKQRGLVIE